MTRGESASGKQCDGRTSLAAVAGCAFLGDALVIALLVAGVGAAGVVLGVLVSFLPPMLLCSRLARLRGRGYVLAMSLAFMLLLSPLAFLAVALVRYWATGESFGN